MVSLSLTTKGQVNHVPVPGPTLTLVRSQFAQTPTILMLRANVVCEPVSFP